MNYYQIFSKFYQIASQEKCLECQDFIERGAKILDLGCGSGIVAKSFQDFFEAEVLGVDIEDSRIVSIPFKKIDGKNLPFEDSSFDVVLISYVLHHSQDPEFLLKEAKRVGKKIIIYEDLPEGVISEIRCIFHSATYNFLFQQQEEKCDFKTEKEWQKIFETLGLKMIAQKRVSSGFDLLDPGQKILFVLESK